MTDSFCDPKLHKGQRVAAAYLVRATEAEPDDALSVYRPMRGLGHYPDMWACCAAHLGTAVDAVLSANPGNVLVRRA